jgi:hypothetical protein
MQDKLWHILIELSISSFICLVIILFAFFQWQIVDYVTPFLMIPIWLFMLILFIVSLISSLICLFKLKKIGAYALLPLALNLLTFWLVASGELTRMWLRVDFALYHSSRDEIVAEVYNGNLRPNVDYNGELISLGSQYPNLSMGGNEICFEQHRGKRFILFFTFRGIMDHYSGFLHVENGGDPSEYSDLSDSKNTEIVHWKGEWYFVSHH